MAGSAIFTTYLEAFSEYQALQQRVLHVLNALPPEVQHDFLSDDRFSVSLDNYSPGKGSTVFMAIPVAAGEPSRSVVLRRRLDDCAEEFAHYVIAHEFAHAYLRNGPWGRYTDVEDAADALADSWGFPRPSRTPWSRDAVGRRDDE